MQSVDINFEFSCLTKIVTSLWHGAESEAAQKAMAFLFQQGLSDGKLWIDDAFSFRISKLLNGNNELALPLSNRRDMKLKSDRFAYLHDALCIFDDNLTSGVREIYSSVVGRTGGEFSRRADKLHTSIIDQFGELLVKPKEMPVEESKALVNEYQGLSGRETRSYSTPQKFCKWYAEYSQHSLGLSYFRTFVANIYSHGLFVAKEYNTRNLILAVLPHYAKRDLPLNLDNGEEILTSTIQNPFVELSNLIDPCEFSSTDEYQKNLAAVKQHPRKGKASREEMRELTKNLLANITAKESERTTRVNNIVDAFAAKVTPPLLLQAA